MAQSAYTEEVKAKEMWQAKSWGFQISPLPIEDGWRGFSKKNSKMIFKFF